MWSETDALQVLSFAHGFLVANDYGGQCSPGANIEAAYSTNVALLRTFQREGESASEMA